jgi:electron transfer flavoprotein alpha subunit
MAGILVVAEHLRGSLRDVTAELVSAAAGLTPELGGRVTVVIVGGDAALAEPANLTGVDEIVTVAGPDGFAPATHCTALAELIAERSPALVLGGFTVDAMAWAPALAATAGVGFASDVTAISVEDGAPVALREAYAGKLQAEVDFPGHSTVLLLLRPTAWPPARGAGSATVTAHTLAAPPPEPVRHIEYREAPVGDVDIATADFVLSVGRGIGEQENLEQFERLAGRLGATLGVSRPLVDAGWVTSDRQVGQSGKTVTPRVYLALGISGAVQHLAGMRGSDTIIAVNSDPDAPIFGVAHYGAVADLFDVAEELESIS